MRLVADIPEPHAVATVELSDQGKWTVTWRDGRYRQFRRKADALDAAGLSTEQLEAYARADCQDGDVSTDAQETGSAASPSRSMMQTRSTERETIPAIPTRIGRKAIRRG